MKLTVEKKAPDFLIVGSAKSGTTSLWYYLDQHPQIFMNKGIKELGYFSDYYGVKDLDEYLHYFNDAKPGLLVGEACHSYLSSPECAKRIFDFNPDMKIIIILRNPVSRAYSLYNWMVQYGYEKAGTFEEAIRLEKERVENENLRGGNNFYYMNYLYFHSGLYYEQVKRYFDLFPRNNIHIIVYEDFRKDNLGHMKHFFRFLGLNDDIAVNLERQNESMRIRNAKLQAVLTYTFYQHADKMLIPRRISDFLRRKLLKFNQVNAKPKPLEESLHKKLLQDYKEDIRKLSTLLSIDLAQYWK